MRLFVIQNWYGCFGEWESCDFFGQKSKPSSWAFQSVAIAVPNVTEVKPVTCAFFVFESGVTAPL
jgi:hypothetical protein